MDAAQGDGWEADDARWTVTQRLGPYSIGSAALRQIDVWDARESADLLVRPLLELFASWVEQGRPRLKFAGWVNERVRDLTAPQLLRLTRALELDDAVLADNLRIRKLASALRAVIVADLEDRLIATVRRWESQGHFDRSRDRSQLQRNLHRATARSRPRRDRRADPLVRPYVPPGAQDLRRAR